MPRHPSLIAVDQATRYLKSCGIRLPLYELTISDRLIGGSMVEYEPLRLTMGSYPTTFTRNWFAIHEIGHMLWAEHRPLRRKTFRKYFGDPAPEWEEYEKIYKRDSWKTATTHKLSWLVRTGLPVNPPTTEPKPGARSASANSSH